MPDKEDDSKSVATLISSIGKYFNVILIAATFFINYGVFRADYIQLEKRVEDIEAQKPEQLRWVQDQHEHKLTTVESEQKSERDTIYEMKTKVDIIAEWVSDQRLQKDKGH